MLARKVTKKRRTDGDYIMDPATSEDLNLKILNDQLDCDLLFIVGPEGEQIWAHKVILKARSSYFYTKLSSAGWADCSNPHQGCRKIELENDDPLIFRSFLKHIYAYVSIGDCPVQAVKLLHMAQHYGVPSLVKMCEKVLSEPFQPDDLLDIFELAKKLELTDVMRKAGETMANYFTQLANSPTFEMADETTLIYLLQRDDLCVEESKLFSILVRWADKRIENSAGDPKPARDAVLKNLLPLVRFPTMDAQEFADLVAPTNVLPVETDRILLMYLTGGEKNKRTLASGFHYSTAPRKSNLQCIELYKEKPRPGRGACPAVALKKRSNVRDILTFRCWGISPTQIRIISFVLEQPRIGEAELFQYSAEVGTVPTVPIKIAISLSEPDRKDSQPKLITEGFRIGRKPVVWTLDKPWILSNEKSYRLTVRFLSSVYTVPDVVEDVISRAHTHKNHRDENYDFFTATALQDLIYLRSGAFCSIDSLAMSGGSGSRAGGSASQEASLGGMSSGLHLLRSIQVVPV